MKNLSFAYCENGKTFHNVGSELTPLRRPSVLETMIGLTGTGANDKDRRGRLGIDGLRASKQ